MNFIILKTLKINKSIISVLMAVLFLVIFAVLPGFVTQYKVIFLSSILLYMILTVSWVIFSGWTGYLSLAPAAFMGLGMYISAIYGENFSFLVVVIIAGLACVILAFIVGGLTLRLHSTYFTIFTFGLILLIYNVAKYIEEHFFHRDGTIVAPQDSLKVYYYLLGIFALLLLTIFIIKRTKYYLALLSISQDEEAAAHIGINVTVLKITVFGISSFFMGAAGAVTAAKWTYVNPSVAFNPFFSFMPVLIALFGGIGILYGPIVGSIVFTYMEEFLLTRVQGLYTLILGIVLLVSVLYLPDGIAGLIHKLYIKKFRGNNENSCR
jgi:branched-chain amino acid transport system permease protein